MLLLSLIIGIIGTIFLGLENIVISLYQFKLRNDEKENFYLRLIFLICGYSLIILSYAIIIYEEYQKRKKEIPYEEKLSKRIAKENKILKRLFRSNPNERTNLQNSIVNLYLERKNIFNLLQQ